MMILKNLTRRDGLKQLFKYVFEKERENLYASKEQLIFNHNYRTTNVNEMIEEFNANELNRSSHRKDAVLVNHLVLSFSPVDTRYLTDEIFKDLVNKCISLKLQRALVCGCEHLDRDFRHVHLIWSNIEYKTGKSLRMSRAEFKNWKMELDKYQKEVYPALSHSLPSHGKQKYFLQKHIDKRHSQQKSIIAVLKQVVKEARTKQEFISKLETAGYIPYHHFDKLQGVMHNGQKFRFKTLGLNPDLVENVKMLSDEINSIDSFKLLREKSSCLREREFSG